MINNNLKLLEELFKLKGKFYTLLESEKNKSTELNYYNGTSNSNYTSIISGAQNGSIYKYYRKHYDQIKVNYESREKVVLNNYKNEITNLIDHAEENLGKLESKLTYMTKLYEICSDFLKFNNVSIEEAKFCDKNFVKYLYQNVKDAGVMLDHIKSDVASIFVKKLIMQHEGSKVMECYYHAKSYFKALQDYNEAMKGYYGGIAKKNDDLKEFYDIPKDSGLSLEQIELKLFNEIIDLQHSGSAWLKTNCGMNITITHQTPNLGEYYFCLDYEKYFHEINQYYVQSFIKKVDYVANKELVDLQFTNQLLVGLGNELIDKFCLNDSILYSIWCALSSNCISNQEESKLYCEIKDLFFELKYYDASELGTGIQIYAEDL